MRWLLGVALAGADFLPGPARALTPEGEPMVCSGREERRTICDMGACDTTTTCSPIDGAWGMWSDWSMCSCSGIKERHRPIAQHGYCGGNPATGPEIEATFCQPKCSRDEPKVCELADWSDWGRCDKGCGGGQRFRERKVTQKSENCGEPCTADLKEVESCNTHDCGIVVDCTLGEWTPWTSCDKACGGGQQRRSRQATHASGGGAGCEHDELHQTQGCNEMCCPGDELKDCIWGEWADWSDCSATCDGGHRNRARVIAQSPRNGGTPCEPAAVMEWGACAQDLCSQPAVVDGLWGDWQDWGLCSRSCGTGYRSRGRQIVSEPLNGGKPATGPAQVYEECTLLACNDAAVDCQFGDWQEWGACSATFKGTKARSRVILRYAERGGKGCHAALAQVTTCNVMSIAELRGPTVDCAFGAWELWSVCSKSCGGGSQTRQRSVVTPAQNGGAGCEGSTHEAMTCNEQVCNPDCDADVDCKWGQWQEWSACTVTCGGGETTRYRSIEKPAMNLGSECAAADSREVAPCNPTPCGTARFCVWGEWSKPSACSAPCGPGVETRTRDLEVSYQEPEEGSIASSVLVEVPAPAGFSVGAAGAGFAAVLAAAALMRPRRSVDRE
jgi:hypothetical protein